MSDAELEAILRQAHRWRSLLAEPDVSDEQLKELERWLSSDPRHREMYDRATLFFDALGEVSKDDLDKSALEASWGEKLRAFTAEVSKRFSKPAVAAPVLGTLLASVLIIGLLSGLRSSEKIEPVTPLKSVSYETQRAEIRTIELEDGSMISLGAASEVEFSLYSSQRVANLKEGEVFFKVANDPARPFKVAARELSVSVTGTAFNVSVAGEEIEVAVADGTVEVSYPLIIDGDELKLESRQQVGAGQQISANRIDGLKPIIAVAAENIGAWRQHTLLYDGDTLEKLVSDANRYSDLNVSLNDPDRIISGLRIRGAFDTDDIDGMLNDLIAIHPVIVDRSHQGKVTIRPE